MINRDIAVLPYQFARTPLVIFDLKVMHRLPSDSPGRVAFDRGFGTLDVLVGRFANNTNLVEQGTERIGRAGRGSRPEPPPAEDQAPEAPAEQPPEEERPATVQAPARQARARATKAKQHADARGNRSVKSIRQGLARTEAVAEAREHRAEQHAEQRDGDGSD